MKQEKKIYKFNCESIKDIFLDKYEKNFTFIVNEQEYKTNRIIADLLSPIINEYHYQDESINEFIVKTTNDDYFDDFLHLIEKGELFQSEATEIRLKRYCEYFLELGNIDEYLSLIRHFTEKITTINVVERLRTLSSIIKRHSNRESEVFFKELVNFASSHFYELDKEEIETLNVDTLERIIDNKELKLESEDSLIEILLDLNEKDQNYSQLFEYVSFNNLNDSSLFKFIDQFSIEFMTEGTWRSISSRLLPGNDSATTRSKKRRYCESNLKRTCDMKYEIIEIQAKEDDKFEGLMKYLTRKTGSNIHDNRTIEITSNSIYDRSHHPKNLVDYDNITYYHSKNDNNIYIRFDFKDKKIQTESYSIQSDSHASGRGHLRNWVVEVSNDCEKWEIIDEHSNDSSLNHSSVISTFQTKKLNSFYRYIQIRQTGVSWYYSNNNFTIYFPYLEFHGKIKIPIKQKIQ